MGTGQVSTTLAQVRKIRKKLKQTTSEWYKCTSYEAEPSRTSAPKKSKHEIGSPRFHVSTPYWYDIHVVYASKISMTGTSYTAVLTGVADLKP